MRFLLLLLVALAACATSYTEDSFLSMRGGYKEEKIGKNTFVITTSGNGFTSLVRARNISVVRAAELTLENGFDRFIVLDSEGRLLTTTLVSPTTSSTQISGVTSSNALRNSTNSSFRATAETTTSGGDVSTIEKPKYTVVVEFIEDQDPRYANATEASEMLFELGPVVGISDVGGRLAEIEMNRKLD